MQFPIVTYQDEDGVWIGEIPALKGVHSFADTLENLYTNLKEAADLFFECENTWQPVTERYSISFLDLHAQTKNSNSQKTPQMA